MISPSPARGVGEKGPLTLKVKFKGNSLRFASLTRPCGAASPRGERRNGYNSSICPRVARLNCLA